MMDDRERRILRALAGMCEQYLSDNSGWLDHQCMSAGEEAFDILVEYGLAEPDPGGGRGGRWTQSGEAFLNA
jgi:hypothetical protein